MSATSAHASLLPTGARFTEQELAARAAAIDALHDSTGIYTAEPIVDQLLDMVDWPSGNRTLVDPSCGDGAFLGRALMRLLAAKPGIEAGAIAALLSGWEIHPEAASEARQRVSALMISSGRTHIVAGDIAARIVRTGDFLLEGPRTPSFHVIAANPPYLRYTNLRQPLRSDYEREMPDYAQADMLHSFIDRCATTLHADGEIVMVTSDRWLANQNAARLREVIGQTWGIAHLERLDCASAFYRSKVRKQGTPPRIHPIAICLQRAARGITPMTREAIYPDASALPLPADGRTLESIAKVILAPWIGTPGIFMVDAATAAERGLPQHHLVPAIDTDDIKGGVLSLDESRRRFVIRADRDEEPCEQVLELLDERLPRMSPRGRRFPRWLTPERIDKHDLSRPCLLVPRIARTLKPIRVPAGILPTDHNLSIVSAGDASLDTIEAALCHPLSQRWMEERASRLEGGFYSITTKLLRTLPVWN